MSWLGAELSGKRLELLKETLPPERAHRRVLSDPALMDNLPSGAGVHVAEPARVLRYLKLATS